MSIEDYLPKMIKYDQFLGFLKYGKHLSFEDYFPQRTFMGLDISISENKTIIKYKSTHTLKQIILYEGISDDINVIIKKCIESFSEQIGNIYDFVDIYQRRNLILEDLI